MNLTKKLVILTLSVSLLSACTNDENSSLRNSNSAENNSEVKKVVKHETENLPVVVYRDSDYRIEGQKVGFLRTVTSVNIKDFDDSTELEYYERYGNAARNLGVDLQKDYKLLEVEMKKETMEEARSSALEAFMLDEGSALVVGDMELANTNDLLLYQQQFLATDFKVGKGFDETGDILMAIPNEYANDPNIQLRIKQQIDGEKKYIYIDLK